MIVKRESKKTIWLPILIFVLVFYYVMRVMALVEENGGNLTLSFLSEALDKLYMLNTPLVFSAKSIGISAFVGLFSLMVYETIRSQNKKNIQEHTYGSAEWNSPDVLKNKKEKDIQDNIILTATEQVSKNTKKSGMNRHIVIVGRPGTGKSRYFFKPNILNLTNGALITDPKGELLAACGKSLKKKGFDIKVFNLDKKELSNHYNPFLYIRKVKEQGEFDEETGKYGEEKEVIREDDVMTLIDVILKNTKSDQIETQTGDPFWEKCETLFLQAVFYYIMEEYKGDPIHQNFVTVMDLIKAAKVDEKGNSELKILFELFREEYGSNHIAIKQWDLLQSAAASQKTFATIVACAASRLSCFNIKEVAELVKTDDMELNRVGMPFDEESLDKINEHTDKKVKSGKVVYFVVTKPSNTTFNFIATIMYTQLFQMIDDNVDKCKEFLNCGERLATPFDIYFDEFSQIGEIPLFLEELAYVRGLDVGIVISLQSLSQLRRIYKDNWETILDCVDTILFLGSNSKETLEYFSQLLGEKTWYKKNTNRTFSRQGSSGYSWDVVGRKLATIDELAKKEKGKCLLYIAEIGPFYSDLYNLKKHPLYTEIYDGTETEQNIYVCGLQKGKTEVEQWEEIMEGLGFKEYKIVPNPVISKVEKEEERILEKEGGILLEELLLSSLKES